MIRLSRESMEEAFIKHLETVFEHPEIIRASIYGISLMRAERYMLPSATVETLSI